MDHSNACRFESLLLLAVIQFSTRFIGDEINERGNYLLFFLFPLEIQRKACSMTMSVKYDPDTYPS